MKVDNGQSLSNIRVLDFTGELGSYASKLYVGLGADVIHMEPITGDPLRNISPFYQNRPDREGSLRYLYYNAGKRGIPVNLNENRGKEVFLKLCETADLLFESFAPGYLEDLGLSYQSLITHNSRLVQVSITPFGHSGPYKDYPGSDLTIAAQGGFLYLAGTNNDKPVRTCDNQSYRMAEAYAATASAIALFSARKTGEGQFVEVSCLESVSMALENAAQYYDLEGKLRRGRGKEAGSCTIHPCEDGYIIIVAIMGKNKVMWEPFVEWMKTERVEEWEVFNDDKWIEPGYRGTKEAYETFCRIFEAYTKQHDKLYLYEAGQAHRVAVTPVSNGKDLIENPQLTYCNFWESMRHENLNSNIMYPGAPYELGSLKWRLGNPAPAFGQHTVEILKELKYSDQQIDSMAKGGIVYVV
ncbi:MAG: CaiB/BaiF CoA transferase family protein [Desulfomonilaceae bacterium]